MTTNSLPQTGWLPDPAHPGIIRFRNDGQWTEDVITRQVPWGPSSFLPPVLNMPVLAVANA